VAHNNQVMKDHFDTAAVHKRPLILTLVAPGGASPGYLKY